LRETSSSLGARSPTTIITGLHTKTPGFAMYNTEGVDAIATITELRSETSDLIEHVRQTKTGVLIQKNNEPYAVLIDWEMYKQIKEKLNLNELRELSAVL
jgi:prevent-host-death family protein